MSITGSLSGIELRIGSHTRLWLVRFDQSNNVILRLCRNTFVATMRPEIIVGSQKWPRNALMQQWHWISLLRLIWLLVVILFGKSTILWAVAINKPACWCLCPWCGVKNIFGISVYFKECTPTIVFHTYDVVRWCQGVNPGLRGENLDDIGRNCP
jgi:hypothetical protein